MMIPRFNIMSRDTRLMLSMILVCESFDISAAREENSI